MGAGGVSGVAGRSRAVFRGSASGSRPRRSPGGGEGPEAAVPGGPGPGEDSGGRSRPPAHVRGVPRHASPGMPRRRLRGSAVARSRGAFPGAEGAWPRRAPLFAGNALPLAEPSHPGNPGNPRTLLPGCAGGGPTGLALERTREAEAGRQPTSAVSRATRTPGGGGGAYRAPSGREALRVPWGEGAWPRRAPLWAGYPGHLAELSNPGNPGNPRTFPRGCGESGRSRLGSWPWGQGRGPPGVSPRDGRTGESSQLAGGGEGSAGFQQLSPVTRSPAPGDRAPWRHRAAYGGMRVCCGGSRDGVGEAGCSQEESPKKGFAMGSRTQGVQEIFEKCM